MLEMLISFDKSLFLFLNSYIANPVFDMFFPFITQRENWIIPGIILAVIFLIKEKKKALIVLGLAIITVAMSDLLCVRILKPVIYRLRPCHPSYFINGSHTFLAGGNFLFGYKKSLSFPSAHAMNMFALAMLFTLFFPKKAIWFFTVASLISFSRIYIGVHYPSDIVAGAIFGIAIGALVYFLYRYIVKKINIKKKEPNSSE